MCVRPDLCIMSSTCSNAKPLVAVEVVATHPPTEATLDAYAAMEMHCIVVRANAPIEKQLEARIQEIEQHMPPPPKSAWGGVFPSMA
jgi:hypothetical protein